MLSYEDVFCVIICVICLIVHTRRGDLESLMYNGLEWLRLDLPWKGSTLKNTINSKSQMKDMILAAKENHYNFKNVPPSEFYKLLYFFTE